VPLINGQLIPTNISLKVGQCLIEHSASSFSIPKTNCFSKEGRVIRRHSPSAGLTHAAHTLTWLNWKTEKKKFNQSEPPCTEPLTENLKWISQMKSSTLWTRFSTKLSAPNMKNSESMKLTTFSCAKSTLLTFTMSLFLMKSHKFSGFQEKIWAFLWTKNWAKVVNFLHGSPKCNSMAYSKVGGNLLRKESSLMQAQKTKFRLETIYDLIFCYFL